MRSYPPLSFPRNYILKSPRSFRAIYKRGIRLKGERLAIYYRISASQPFQVGFSTGKQFKKAVMRNRARRLMREAFRLHQHEVREGRDYVFIWLGPIDGIKLADVEERMLDILKRGGLLK